MSALDLVANSGLNAIAAECLRRAEKEQGCKIYDARALLLLLVVRCMGALHQREQFGRMLCAALAFGAAVGYDIESALRDAIRRDAERAKEGA